MTRPKIIITPKTKVGEFLEAYPELEKTLMEMSPAFAKLKNPVLRKTIGRVATLQQAAAVGGLKVDELVNRLRKEAGQAEYSVDEGSGSLLMSVPPAWFHESAVKISYDAVPVINSGESPMSEILKRAQGLEKGSIMEVITPFVPAPIADILVKQGFEAFSLRKGELIHTYFSKTS